MAEGTTLAGSNLFYMIHNPGATAADVEVRYLLQAPRVSLSKTYHVGPSSRFTIWVNAEAQADPALAALSSVDVSAAITPTTPVIAERAMYIDRDGQSLAVGHGSPGITTTATSWFFAEGATGPFFDLFLTLVNPAAAAAHVEAVYTLPSGEIVRKPHVIPANSRMSIWVDREDARLADTAVSATVRSTNGVEFVAERSMRWPGRGASPAQEEHNSAGTPAAAKRRGIAEGEVGGAGDTDTVLTVVNTSAMPGRATITLVFEDGTMTAGSPQAMMMVTPGKNNNFQRRSVAGGVSEGTTGAAVKAPYWVKFTRSGTTVTAYQSADGLAWSIVGTATVALPAHVLIGLAVSSHSPTIRATATFDQVAIAHP